MIISISSNQNCYLYCCFLFGFFFSSEFSFVHMVIFSYIFCYFIWFFFLHMSIIVISSPPTRFQFSLRQLWVLNCLCLDNSMVYVPYEELFFKSLRLPNPCLLMCAWFLLDIQSHDCVSCGAPLTLLEEAATGYCEWIGCRFDQLQSVANTYRVSWVVYLD